MSDEKNPKVEPAKFDPIWDDPTPRGTADASATRDAQRTAWETANKAQREAEAKLAELQKQADIKAALDKYAAIMKDAERERLAAMEREISLLNEEVKNSYLRATGKAALTGLVVNGLLEYFDPFGIQARARRMEELRAMPRPLSSYGYPYTPLYQDARAQLGLPPSPPLLPQRASYDDPYVTRSGNNTVIHDLGWPGKRRY